MRISTAQKTSFSSRSIAIFAIGFSLAFAFFCLSFVFRSRVLQEQLFLKNDVNQIFNRIEGGPLKLAQLHAAEVASEFLKFQFQEIARAGDARFEAVEIWGGKDGKDNFGQWRAGRRVAEECKKRFEKSVHPDTAFYPFQIVLVVNTCIESEASKSIGTALVWIPIILCGVLLLCLGALVYSMLRSVRLADEIIAQNEDPEVALARSDEIGWSNVRTLLKRAVETKGKNLQFFHALIRNTEHDASHIINQLSNRLRDPIAARQISTLQSLLTRLRAEISQPTLPFDDRACFELGLDEFLKNVKEICPACDIECVNAEVAETVSINDKLALERLVLNLWTNAQKHGVGQVTCSLRKINSCLRFEISNRTTLVAWLRLKFAFLSGRVDLTHRDEPVISRFIGREGLGLSIAKQSALALGAQFFLNLRGRALVSGFELEVASSGSLGLRSVQRHNASMDQKRVFCFASAELKSTIDELGLRSKLIHKNDISRLVAAGDVEIVSDEELNVPRGTRFKLVERRDRLVGLAKAWGYV